MKSLPWTKLNSEQQSPTVIAYHSSSENDLGFEWILMEKIPGAPLRDICPLLSDTSKATITREIASYVLQMRKNCVFHEIGMLYHDSNAEFIIEPMVAQSMFMSAWRQLITRNCGSYHHDSDYARALIDVQIADVHFLKTIPSNDPDFDKDVLEDGPTILHAMEGELPLILTIFPRDEKNDSHNSFTLRSFTQRYYG